MGSEERNYFLRNDMEGAIAPEIRQKGVFRVLYPTLLPLPARRYRSAEPRPQVTSSARRFIEVNMFIFLEDGSTGRGNSGPEICTFLGDRSGDT